MLKISGAIVGIKSSLVQFGAWNCLLGTYSRRFVRLEVSGCIHAVLWVVFSMICSEQFDALL